jgi:hypothetical protein
MSPGNIGTYSINLLHKIEAPGGCGAFLISVLTSFFSQNLAQNLPKTNVFSLKNEIFILQKSKDPSKNMLTMFAYINMLF